MGRAPDWRYQRFAAEFFVDCDAAAAYKRAGGKARTPNAVYAGVCELLRNPKVQQALAAEFARLQARLDLTQDRHALEVCRVAYSDLREICAWGLAGVVLKPSDKMAADAAAAVQRVTSQTRILPDGGSETRIAVTVHPKVPALALLATMFHRGEAVRRALETKLQALAALAGKYVSREDHAAYFAEVRLVLGDTVAPDDRLPGRND